MKISEVFGKFVADLTYDQLPEDVILAAKERILDTLGASITGEATWTQKEAFLRACQQFGKGSCSIVGSPEKRYTVDRAAMINAVFAHSMELDDGHKNAGCHAGAVVVPTALAMGEELHATGKEILTAVVIGYEIVYRIVEQMTPYQIQKGFHPSGNCDVFGAMAVAGKLLGLSGEQLANGFGFAGLFASGLMEATISGQLSKCVMVGNAALNGIAAAYYAKENMEGTKTIFEGEKGFFHAQAGPIDFEYMVKDLGSVFRIRDTYSKMYPTCRHSQAGIEAALDLSRAYGIDWKMVDHVNVATYQVAYDLTGVIKHPKDAAEAKFSLPYGIALALHEHACGVGHLFPEYTENPELNALSDLVTVTVDPRIEGYYPKKRGAKVTITLKDGRSFSKELYDLKGSPRNPVGWNELVQKFRANVGKLLPEEKCIRIIDAIKQFDQSEAIHFM